MNELKSIGRFTVEKFLYSSPSSDCFRAKDTVLNRNVMLRVFNSSLLKKSRTRSLLLQSLQKSADLVHPHIAWVWDLGEEDGKIYAAERFIDGTTLDEFLKANQRKTWEQAQPVFRQAAQALQFAHDRDVIHGNLSPVSLTLSTELGAVLSGFGLYQVFNPDNETTKFSDQAGLARLLVSMVSGRAELPSEFDLLEVWPLSAPRLVIKALGRALGFTDEWQYPSIEEFARSVSDQASQPQPVLTVEEAKKLEVEEALWKEKQEAAQQAAEQAARLEALEAARREINEQIQLTRQDDSAQEEESEDTLNESKALTESDQKGTSQPESENEIDSSSSIIKQDAGKAGSIDEDSHEEIRDTSTSSEPDHSTKPVKTLANQVNPEKPVRKRRTTLWIILLIFAILVIFALIWVLTSGYVLPAISMSKILTG